MRGNHSSPLHWSLSPKQIHSGLYLWLCHTGTIKRSLVLFSQAAYENNSIQLVGLADLQILHKDNKYKT